MRESITGPPASHEESQSRPSGAHLEPHALKFAHALLFTGHMIDRADRAEPRFPASAEDRARHAIHTAIAAVQWMRPGATVGLAAAASGGDLLFHECCEDLGIPTRVLLALPPEEFEAESVAPAGPRWMRRFHAVLRKAGPDLLVMESKNEPLDGDNTNVWQRANLWMIQQATRIAPECAMLALWDGKAGDGPGGTEQFLELARRSGIRVLEPIQMQSLL